MPDLKPNEGPFRGCLKWDRGAGARLWLGKSTGGELDDSLHVRGESVLLCCKQPGVWGFPWSGGGEAGALSWILSS